MQLYKAAMLHSFGSNAKRPWLSASLRLAALAVCSLACGFALSLAAGHLPIATLPDSGHMLAIATLSTQAVVAATLLMASGSLARIYQGTFARWLWVLPLHVTVRWLALMVPSLALVALTLLLIAWPLGTLWHQLGLNYIAIALSMLAGAASALGLVHGLPQRLSGMRFLCVPLGLYTEYTLVHTNTPAIPPPLWCFAGIVLLLSAVWLLSSNFVRADIQRVSSVTARVHSVFPSSWWFAKKVFRAASMRLSLVAGLVLSSFLAFAGVRYALSSDIIAMGTALLMASCAADVRGLCRRYMPAEITALCGTSYFFYQHAMVVVVLCGLIATPLFWHTKEFSFSLTAPLLTGMAAGLCAGNLAVPRPHDISSQVLAGLLCIIPLFVLPMAPGFPEGPAVRAWTHAGMAAAFVCAAYAIEYKRNPYTWRKS